MSERGKGGQEGNDNASRPFFNALRRAIAADGDERASRLRKAAEKLLDAAAEGEAWAIKELADRMDGKASQAVTMQNPDGSAIFDHIQITLRRAGHGDS